ncbi:polysaccharide pyruvyl transferase family protein [Pseudoalteromonas carrageenovora]|uniref:polysaccharide pyruvyl transferase family protein n=1 Tax=Pseudoalteromonas carrageenovora TaxID=227 RepID=UPI0026E2991B|nr:polysaccharide pyruvyl transferase family protein [Pseudoalteromonas carrageenovora]MDO6548921.1 polysaccharide pyruvyl transferase family protein [Pseudoalteromonas carrageenovora]MDO6833426.1 polysaccharide pyruvyl transferase family protein [Pseudoalteromonas carrageenovora]
MMVEVKGIGLPNRGAELMLLALIEQFESRGIDASFVVEPLGDYKTRTKYNLFQKSRFFGKGYNFGWPFSLFPKIIREKYGIVNKNEIDLVIDASGFAYGDKWGAKLINDRLGKEIDYFKNKKVKVILLPQAFGSFKDKAVAEASKKIFEKVDILMARDNVSFKYVKELGDFKNLTQFPDFTNLVKPEEVPKYAELKGRACVIPNFQMIKRGSAGEQYAKTLAAAIENLERLNKKPYLLIHEGVRDLELAHSVNALLKTPVEIIDPQDALEIKSIISKSSILIGSRFHGIVSALSTGVPVIAMGWSHKYEMLLQEYGVEELLVEVDKDKVNALASKIIEDDEYRKECLLKINTSSKKLKLLSETMWEQVFKVISA